ncbi:MAG TPA: hypothetical protein PLZ93_06220 [Nocardioides sp.]|nr:hypothetical protein [Nocardioides sp.]HRK47811.1 hypothetical protein [Nocardioides sp.]
MHHLLGSFTSVVLLVAVPIAALGACGDEGGDPATDAASTTSTTTSTATATAEPGQSVDHELVRMITETAAGGATSALAVPLDDDAALQAFNQQFETDAIPTQVEAAVAATEVPDGMALYGAVVAVGCDAPTDVSVTQGESGLEVTAQKVPSPLPECFAPMTTVALLLAPGR